jgi:hypothetical protein
MKINWTYATKAIVSLFGNASVLSSVSVVTWKELATAAATALLVWLVPNTTKAIPVKVNAQQPIPVGGQITANERDELNALRAQKGM